jgi:hypothetical protein
MTVPVATRAQLTPLVERAVADAGTSDRGVLVLVHADPDSLPTLGAVADRPVAVHGSRSPLEIRRLARDSSDGVLVVLTDCDDTTLGHDLVARGYRHRIHTIDRWATVCALFGAERPTAELARKPHLADALVEAAPNSGYPRIATRVLDTETAAAALVRIALCVDDEVADLGTLLLLLQRPESAGRFAAVADDVRRDLLPALRSRFGAGIDAALAAVDSGRSSDIVALGLVAAAVYAPPADDVAATVRFDERLGGAGLSPAVYRAWGQAAESVADARDDPARAAGWIERAGSLLHELNADHLAERSDLLPAGFDQRISAAAAALTRWGSSRGDAALAGDAHAAIDRVAAHGSGRHAPDRVERLRMVARLLRRGSFGLEGLDDLASAATAYERDGAWLDAARLAVSRRDADPTFAALCASLTAEADQARVEDGRRFATNAAVAATAVPPAHVAIEDVLDRVVVPLAATRRVLVLVLDGLGWPTFTEVLVSLESMGWSPWRQSGDGAPGFVGVAALPTVTEVSRCSLFAGRLRTGDADSEQRAFAAHSGLLTVTGAGPKPELFHKRNLRAGGLDTLPQGLLDAVADERRKVVGLVINNIDERLKDVAQPVGGWALRDLDPLSWVLDEARRSGRAIVLAADHGHVLDRDAEARAGIGGGERWRHPEPPPGDGEVLVQGPRVVTGDHRAVLAAREQLRYGPRRNGYHGGLTPQELFVPVVVLCTDDLPASSGWVPAGFRRPAWWHQTRLRPSLDIDVEARAAVLEPPSEPTLFDESAAVAPTARVDEAVLVPDWVDGLLASELLRSRRASPRVRLGDAELRRLLVVLALGNGIAIPLSRLAEEAELPRARIARYVAQLQELLNVEGYPVVTVSAATDEVRVDVMLLRRQFAL